jgi:putative peptidoglycan lipid II flippase
MFGSPVPLDEKSNAVLSYTQTLYQFPLGVFGIAVATAAFPLLARTAHDPSAVCQHAAPRGAVEPLHRGPPRPWASCWFAMTS